MTFKRPYSAGLAALAVGMFAATAAYAEPTVNKGDNAWMLTSTVLVLLMTIPGLALFYGGLVRSKNMLSVLMQVFYTVCIVTLLWALYGYSLAFTGGSDFIGGFSKAFLMGVTPDSKAATFSVDANISELVYVCFQMTFAAITPCLIVGSFAERMKFSAVALFIPLWVTLIYFPIAHMVWYWAGPTPSPMRSRRSQPRVMRRQRPRRRPSLTKSTPMPAGSSRRARSTSPAAPWCTSTRASPAWSAHSWSASASATAKT